MPASAIKRGKVAFSSAAGMSEPPAKKKRATASKSPTQRSLAHLRSEGYQVAIVERWNPHARIRVDLFGIFDLLAIRRDEVLGVQVTASGVSSRVKKITDHEMTPHIREANIRILVHGWRCNAAGKWVLREVDLS